jgi:hypothetical protein
MPAILGPAAQRINASVAGFTHTPEAPVSQPTGHSLAEVPELLPTEYGGLQHLFREGLTPGLVEPVVTALQKPTSSLRGVLGGLRPNPVMHQPTNPGPALGTPHDVGAQLAPPVPRALNPGGLPRWVTTIRQTLGL